MKVMYAKVIKRNNGKKAIRVFRGKDCVAMAMAFCDPKPYRYKIEMYKDGYECPCNTWYW